MGFNHKLTPLVLALALALNPSAALPQTTPVPVPVPVPDDGKAEGLSLVERGMQLFFNQLLGDLNPALEDMKQALTDLEPMVMDLGRLIGDVRNYDPPERLQNGDIIIRRKAGTPPPPDLAPEDGKDHAPEGQTDL